MVISLQNVSLKIYFQPLVLAKVHYLNETIQAVKNISKLIQKRYWIEQQQLLLLLHQRLIFFACSNPINLIQSFCFVSILAMHTFDFGLSGRM